MGFENRSINLDAGDAEARNTGAGKRPFPQRKLLVTQRIAAESLCPRDQSARDCGQYFSFAPCNPAFCIGSWKIGKG